MWYIYKMEYYSAIKNEIMPFAATRMDLEMIILSEVKSDKDRYDIAYIWNLKYDTNELIYETETDSGHRNREENSGCQGLGVQGNWQTQVKGDKISVIR